MYHMLVLLFYTVRIEQRIWSAIPEWQSTRLETEGSLFRVLPESRRYMPLGKPLLPHRLVLVRHMNTSEKIVDWNLKHKLNPFLFSNWLNHFLAGLIARTEHYLN